MLLSDFSRLNKSLIMDLKSRYFIPDGLLGFHVTGHSSDGIPSFNGSCFAAIHHFCILHDFFHNFIFLIGMFLYGPLLTFPPTNSCWLDPLTTASCLNNPTPYQSNKERELKNTYE